MSLLEAQIIFIKCFLHYTLIHSFLGWLTISHLPPGETMRLTEWIGGLLIVVSVFLAYYQNWLDDCADEEADDQVSDE